MFRINLENLVKNKIYIAKEYHIQPSEVDRLMFFEYELYLEQLNLIAKKQEEEQKKQQEDYDNMRSNMNPSKMMNTSSIKMPSVNMPNMGTMNMPKINIPKM